MRYELLRSFVEGKGLFGIAIHSIPKFKEGPDIPGINPFSQLGIEIKGQQVRFKEWDGQNQRWVWSTDVPSMPLADVRYNLYGQTDLVLSNLFRVYDWTLSNGFANLGSWIEAAAQTAGR